ncbi:MAG: permease-like cell division protein FtsX [Paramuribaculum sp.]|nr:permease-like cell division protein FtsX [Paramuribaculum sp.]
MRKNNRHSIPLLSSQLTATVSVALVLLILGVMALLGVAAKNAADDIRSRIGFVVIMTEDADAAATQALKKTLEAAPYTAAVNYSSADDVLRKWNESMDAGADSVNALLGINPFLPEFEVAVKSEYASADSLSRIVKALRPVSCISDIKMQADMVSSINATIRSLGIVLLCVATALLMISFVLINNTVRLTVYARRFSIHTMKLVGATASFIRRPFIVSNMLNGIVAAFIATAILCGALFYAGTARTEITQFISWSEAAWIFAGLFAAGIIICTLAAFFAANRYLRLGYDDMF